MSCSNQKWGEISTGVSGYVREATGNQMPDPSRPLPEPAPLKAMVYIYELTPASQTERIGSSSIFRRVNTRLVDSVNSDSKGYYQVDLPAGIYSMFIKRDEGLFASISDDKNNINPFTVENGKVTRLDVVVNNKAAY